ncbi:MAG TPA: hypothetical protein ENI22_02105 [Candidatus Pacearchaeota archaeon]|nr:hypothetical protein [Candidatus Pacearchaeota archaeon]
MGIFEKDVELRGVTGSLCTETDYLVGYYDSKNGVIRESCDRRALISRLTAYFEGGPIESIQVLRESEEYPFFEEISNEKLREMYESHKKDLEQKVSS